MTAPILFTIWTSWTALEYLARLDRRIRAGEWAAPVAGLACAAFGIWYF